MCFELDLKLKGVVIKIMSIVFEVKMKKKVNQSYRAEFFGANQAGEDSDTSAVLDLTWNHS